MENRRNEKSTVVQHTAKGSNPHFIWIEIETSLIIRVEEHQKMSFQSSDFTHSTIIGEGDLSCTTIIRYRPTLNAGILEDQLEFGEPFAGYGEDVELIFPKNKRV